MDKDKDDDNVNDEQNEEILDNQDPEENELQNLEEQSENPLENSQTNGERPIENLLLEVEPIEKNEEENPPLEGEQNELPLEGEPTLEGEQLPLNNEEIPPPPPANPFEESLLEPEVKLLLEMIFNEEIYLRQLASEGVDLSRFDVKTFTQENMNKAYGILTELIEHIIRKKPNKILEISSMNFYQIIPHKFPQKKLMLLDSEAKIFAKIELLNLINDIQISFALNEEQKQLKIQLEKERREKEKLELEELEKKKKAAQKPGPKGKFEKEKEKEKEKEIIEGDLENKEEQKPEEEMIVIEDVKNFFDRNYENLHCAVQTLSRSTKQFELVSNYLYQTLQGISQFYSCEIDNIYKLSRESDQMPEKNEKELLEEKLAKEKETVKNQPKKKGKIIEEEIEKTEAESMNPGSFEYYLLMYGCKISNLAANLSKGLRLPYASAPMKAYKLGKGIYLSDSASKSTNFCYASKENDVGFLLICQVDLGVSLEKTAKDYEINLGNLPKGRKSVKGLGRLSPFEEKVVDLVELEQEKIREEEDFVGEMKEMQENDFNVIGEDEKNENEINERKEEVLNNLHKNNEQNKEKIEPKKEHQEKKNEIIEEKQEILNNFQKNNEEKMEIKKEKDEIKKENDFAAEPKKIRVLKVPSGELKSSPFKDSSFLYNEYVVFEEKQIKVSYLVKLKFNYK